jgi:hypothetical protein
MTGVAAPLDDASIPSEAELWRRIPPEQMTGDGSERRPSTANFEDAELSVAIAAECTGGLDALLKGHDSFGVASFTAGFVRALGLGVVRDPIDAIPGHANVTGNKTKSKRKQIARACKMVHDPSSRR